MTATIIPFPKKNAVLIEAQFYSTEMLHLDLAANWLEERKWYAESGALQGLGVENCPALVTDAPTDLVTEAFEIAHGHVCEFLLEEFNLSDAELPTLAEFASHKFEVGAYGGRVGVWAFMLFGTVLSSQANRRRRAPATKPGAQQYYAASRWRACFVALQRRLASLFFWRMASALPSLLRKNVLSDAAYPTEH